MTAHLVLCTYDPYECHDRIKRIAEHYGYPFGTLKTNGKTVRTRVEALTGESIPGDLPWTEATLRIVEALERAGYKAPEDA